MSTISNMPENAPGAIWWPPAMHMWKSRMLTVMGHRMQRPSGSVPPIKTSRPPMICSALTVGIQPLLIMSIIQSPTGVPTGGGGMCMKLWKPLAPKTMNRRPNRMRQTRARIFIAGKLRIFEMAERRAQQLRISLPAQEPLCGVTLGRNQARCRVQDWLDGCGGPFALLAEWRVDHAGQLFRDRPEALGDGFNGFKGSPTVEQPRPQALDEAVAKRLWTVSEELTGVVYPPLSEERERSAAP